MLGPEVILLIGVDVRESARHRSNHLGIVEMKHFIKVIFQLTLPLHHRRLWHNCQRTLYVAPYFQLFQNQTRFNGFSHSYFVRQQKTILTRLHHFFQHQYLMWQGYQTTFVRSQNIFTRHFIFYFCSNRDES